MNFIISIFLYNYVLKNVLSIFAISRYANAPNNVTESTSLPIPPPPINHLNRKNNQESANSIMNCPICRTKRKNETLVPSSGYVFCYKCIISHLRSEDSNGACPVTGLPVREDDLIRLFPPGSE